MHRTVKDKGPSVAELLSDCGVTKAGWVHSSGQVFWNRRYLLVKQDEGKLYYFLSNLDPSPKRVIELADGVSIREETGARAKKGSFCFTIFSAAKSFTFACDVAAEQESWMSVLVDAGIGIEEEESLGPDVPSSLFDYNCRDIDGNEVDLSKYAGNVCLVVNVATA